MSVYNNPKYYDIAFSFRDLPKEVDFFEACIKKFSKIKVNHMLEIGCGSSPYLEELYKRGYGFAGLDINRKMIDFTKEKARQLGIPVKTIRADMRNFKTPGQCEFSFVMLGSLYFMNNTEFLSHLDSMARCLKKGALYLIDGGITFNPRNGNQLWTIRRESIKIRANYQKRIIDYINQLSDETITLWINDKGKSRVIVEKSLMKVMYPQEFLALLKLNDKFEFLGWYPDFSLKHRLKNPPKEGSRIMTILRRK